jgi:hypothetical protein
MFSSFAMEKPPMLGDVSLWVFREKKVVVSDKIKLIRGIFENE